MLIVKTKLAESKIQGAGIGLFASQDIEINQVVWQYNGGWSVAVFQPDPNKMPEAFMDFLFTYGCKQPNGTVALNLDNTRFINHSDTPNLKSLAPIDGQHHGNNIAIMNIPKGTELTIDYRTICEDCKNGDLVF